MSLLLAELARRMRGEAPGNGNGNGGSPPSSYDQVVTGLSGGAPLAYWRFSNAGAIIDEMPGERDGTWSGAVTLVGGLPQESDQATSLPGTVFGTVSHDAGLALSAFSLSGWFVVNSLGQDQVIFSKDAPGFNNTDYTLWVVAGGTLRSQFQSGSANFQVNVADIQTGHVYHFGVAASNAGHELWIEGRHMGTDTFTSALQSNTQPLLFGSAQWTSDNLTGVLDEIALWPRVLSDAEFIELSQKVGAPVAGSDSTSVDEGQSVISNVAAISQYVGRKSSLIITPGSTSHGTASVNGNNDIVYEADPDVGGEVESLTYTITDANGTSASGTITIQIEGEGGGGGGAEDAYGSDTLALSGMVAYWRLGDTSTATLADSSGNGRTGSYSGSPTLGVADLTWGNSDGRAVNFASSGYGTVPHNAVFVLPRGSLAFYFRVNSLGSGQTLVNKGGGFVVRVLGTGALQLITTSQTQQTVPTLIEAGVEYHVIIAWDQVQSWMFLDGRVVHYTRDHTAGLTGTSPWEFGRHTDGSAANARMDEVALFNRRISWTEADLLSEYIRGLPYHPTASNTINVSTTAQLITAFGNAGPGTHIVMANGTYQSLTGTWAINGAKRNPVVIRPAVGATVTIRASTPQFEGRWWVFDGVRWEDVGIIIRRSSCRFWRFTRCRFREMTGRGTPSLMTVRIFGLLGRFDHCDMAEIVGDDVQGIRVIIRPTAQDPDGTQFIGYYNLFDHNYFHDTASGDPNAGECLSFGSNAQNSEHWAFNTTYRCIFDNTTADQEVCSIKCNGIMMIENTYMNFQSGPVGMRTGPRQGGWMWSEREWFEGFNGHGLRIINKDNVLIGDRFVGSGTRCNLWVGSLSVADWNPQANPSGYPAATDTLLIGCSMTSSAQVIVGFTEPTNANVLNTVIRDCTGTVTLVAGRHTNTTQTGAGTAPIPFTPAVKLAVSDVGLAAPDPLVPEGWK